MAGEIGSAFVRIRPNLLGFKGEAEHGIKSALRSVGGNVPGLTRANEQLTLFARASNRAGEAAVLNSRRIRSAKESEARTTVAATLRERRSLQELLVEYRALAVSAKLSGDARIIANSKAAETALLLGAPLSKGEQQHHSRAHGELGKLERGAVAGSGAFRSLGRSVAYSSGAFLGAYGFIGVVRKALSSESEFINQQTRTRTVFRSSAGEILAWSKTTAHALGLARTTALDAADSFGTVFEAAGIAPGRAAKFSEDLTKVGAAISLAHGDQDPERANKALRTGLSGRGRALREYGIILDQTTIKAKAAELGLVQTHADPTKILLAERRLGEASAKLALDRADPKKSPLQIAKDEDAVIAAHAKLKKEIAGTTGPLSNQAKTLAAHAIIMEQSKRAVDRYGVSLDTAAGRSRKFHESVDEVAGEVGHELYPSFKRIQGSVTSYLLSLAQGGSRHRQFIHTIHELSSAAHFAYEIFRTGARVVGLFTRAVGGLGNALKIVATLWAVNKIYSWSNALRGSALATRIFGDAAVVAAGRGSTSFGKFGRSIPTGRVGRLKSALGSLPTSLKIGITLVIGYELAQHFSSFLAKKLGLSTAHGNVGGDTTSFLGIPGLGSGAVAEDKLRAGNPYPPGTELYYAFAAGKSGKGRHVGLPGGGSLDVPKHGATADAFERGVRARAKGLDAKSVTDAKTSARSDGADVGNSFGDGVAKALAAKRATIRHELAQVTKDLAEARAEAASQIAAAVREARQAEREAILSAKSNLNSLGGSLADQIGQLIDKRAERQTEAPTGPLAARLHQLEKLIHEGKATPALIAEAKKLEHELNEQGRLRSGDTAKRKERITRRLADLTDELNTGKISLARFNREVTRLLRREGISYKAAGRVLGISFADGFREALKELRAQAAAIANTPARLRRLGTGFDQQIIRPAQVIREQAKAIAAVEREQKKRIGELVTKQEALLKEARAVGLTAKQQRHTIIGELKKGNGHREKSSRDRPKARHDKPRADLTDTLLKRVVAVGHDELVATRRQNDLLRGVIRADQIETAVIRKGDQSLIRGDERARAQRALLLHAERHQTRVLERMLDEEQKQTALLREERKRPRVSDRVKNPRRASDEAVATATHNLLGS